jgi:protein-S-isoprenylcysteine O-methyltransferase Ste14
MPETGPPATDTPRTPQSGSRAFFESIPLTVRMFVYGTVFLAFVLGFLPWLAYRVDVHWPAWHMDIGVGRWLGVVIFVVCVSIYGYSSYMLSSRGRGAYVEFDPPQAFVAVGPFRWCRNPVAGSLVGAVLGEAILFSSTGISLLFIAALPLAHIQVVALEEPLLRQRFGQPYEDYLRHVPRWLPRRPREPGP